MQDLVGKTAFVTGGASGIGLALGRTFAQAGMNVMLADIEAAALTGAVRALQGTGPGVRGVICDVADPASVDGAANAAYQAFGTVHVVCNNAGVGGGGGIDAISLDTWRWVLDVNLMGVLHGIRTFLPHIRAHGEGGHIVNTASMAGMNSGLGFSPYAASKFAVVNMSEGLAKNGRPLGHWRDRSMSRVCANANLGERAQPTGALWAGADAGPYKRGGQAARQACRIWAVGARSIRRCGTSSQCCPQ
jgi:NAD(P)-dependent dehydrogenase (short-subunit alcohol dehydrogenase family)